MRLIADSVPRQQVRLFSRRAVGCRNELGLFFVKHELVMSFLVGWSRFFVELGKQEPLEGNLL